MALMPAVRPPRQAQGHSEVPWGQLLVASIAVAFLVLLGTGHIRIAPSVPSTGPALPPRGNSALRWADHPPSLGLPGQLPHWLGAAARPPGSRQLEDGPLLNDTVPFSSHSFGGDAWLYRSLFGGMRHGFFVEVGAGNGSSGPSHWLQVAAGWRGMLIEGDDGAYRQLSRSRPDAICLHAAVCGGRFGTVHWASRAQRQQQGRTSGSGGGIWELMPEERRQTLGGGSKSAEGWPTVQCYPLQYILDKFGVLAIDLLTINVAGAELEVLKGLDFTRLVVTVLTVGRSVSSAAGTGSDGQQRGSQDAAIGELLAAAGFEAVPNGPGGDSQRQGAWAVFVNARLRHKLRHAQEA